MSSENNNQPSRLKLSIAFVICSLFIAGVVGYKDYISYKSQLNFVVDIQASQPGVSQVFFDVGHGDNEQDSYSIRIQGANPQLCIFPLPIQTIKSFRFDPINVAAVVKIKEARIENNQGNIIKKFPVQSFRPVQQISKMDIADGTLIIHTVENANDPIIGIENSSLEISLIKNQVSWGGYLIKQGWKYFGYCLLSLLFFSGLFYFVIDASPYFAGDDRFVNHFRRYELGDMEDLLGNAGLNPVAVQKVLGPMEKITMILVISSITMMQRLRHVTNDAATPPWIWKIIIPLFKWINYLFCLPVWLDALIVPRFLSSVLLIRAVKM